jgi:hypothetical protein
MNQTKNEDPCSGNTFLPEHLKAKVSANGFGGHNVEAAVTMLLRWTQALTRRLNNSSESILDQDPVAM